jgi:hypothetical protein
MTAFYPSQSCNVCGSAAVQTDEVLDAGRLILSECARCRHRWTLAPQLPTRPAAIRVRRVAPGEVAMAS